MIQADNTLIDTESAEIFLGRSPILDGRGKITAYEMLFKSQESLNNLGGENDLAVSSNIIINAMSHFGLESVLGECDGFLPVTGKLLVSNTMTLLPPKRIVLEIIEQGQLDAGVVLSLKALKRKGFRLALTDIDLLDTNDELLSLLDIIKINLSLIKAGSESSVLRSFAQKDLKGLVSEIRKTVPQAAILVSQVDSEADFEECKKLKVNFFQGQYFAKPTLLRGKKPKAEQMSLMQLIGLLFKDSDVASIEPYFKNSPDLTLGLLRLVNSVGIGGHMQIASVRQALVVLGQKQLLQWMLLLVYTHAGSKLNNDLQQRVVNRAKLLELLSQHDSIAKPGLSDQAFMVGMLSLADHVADLSLDEILKQIPLAEPLQKALLYREGFFGELLSLTEAIESVNFPEMERIRKSLGMTAEDITKLQLQAIQWSNTLTSKITKANS